MKPSEAAFSTIFFRGNFRQEVDSDVISGVIVDPTGVKVRVNFGYSRSKCSRGMRLSHFVTNVPRRRRRRSSHKGKTT